MRESRLCSPKETLQILSMEDNYKEEQTAVLYLPEGRAQGNEFKCQGQGFRSQSKELADYEDR